MSEKEPNIKIPVDLTNPGQFFACCGLLELADRLWPGAEGWFSDAFFQIRCAGTLDQLVHAIAHADLTALDPDDATASPMLLRIQDMELRLDWWHDELAGGREMKVWAGSMESVGIARSMQNAMKDEAFKTPSLLNIGMVVRDVDNPKNKKEPFYFDSRRAMNAHSRDIGFSPNDLQLTTTAYPAVEFLCLVGLQRALPASSGGPRMFAFSTWHSPLTPALVSTAAAGLIPQVTHNTYRFENWFRTGQRKHKAFKPAVLIYQGV